MEVFATPFIIPLGAFAVAIVAIVAGIWSDANNKRVRADQRMAMLARGMSLEDIEKVLGKGSEEHVRRKIHSAASALHDVRASSWSPQALD